ncbi:uncharacterized protein LOC119165983 [Rhipicephalus microplus]|uniref:uncharacterized protein LOC119165983 n=1 Tax=Rhipicephalus microplus TaxID=6941 RepID=UPI003F6AEC9B
MSSDGRCAACHKCLSAPECIIQCSDCSCRYHTGVCSGVSEKTIKTKGEAYRIAWRCPTCRRNKLRDPVKKPNEELETQDVRLLLVTINDKLDQLLPLRDVVEGIEDSLQFWSEQYDDLLRRVEQNEHHIKELRHRTEKLETQNSNVSEMEAEIDNLEWRSQRLNLEFHGIMPTENEDLLNKVNALAPDVELPPLPDDAVVAIHRLPFKKGKISGIICRFARQADRDKWWKNRNKLRGRDDHVYILENLTKRTRALLQETKSWAKDVNFKHAWHNNGRVLVRKDDKDKAVVVTCISDLDKLS